MNGKFLYTQIPIDIPETAGDHILCTPEAGKICLVWRLYLVSAKDVTIQFKRDGVLLTGPMALLAGVPLVLPFTEGSPWFESDYSEGIVLNTDKAARIGGSITHRHWPE